VFVQKAVIIIAVRCDNNTINYYFYLKRRLRAITGGNWECVRDTPPVTSRETSNDQEICMLYLAHNSEQQYGIVVNAAAACDGISCDSLS